MAIDEYSVYAILEGMGQPVFGSLENERPQLWSVDFVVNSNGRCYADDDLLEDLRTHDYQTLGRVFKKIDWLTHNLAPEDFFRSHYYKPLDNGLVELRLSVGSEVRFIGFVSYDAPSPILYVLCGFRKKSDPIPTRHLKHALQRKQEIVSIRGPTR